MDSEDGYDYRDLRDDGEAHGLDHEYPTYEHRQNDFEGKMEPRPPTENELKFLRHIARRLRIRMGLLTFISFFLLIPIWELYFAKLYDTFLYFSLPSFFAYLIFLFWRMSVFEIQVYPLQWVDTKNLRETDVLTKLFGEYHSQKSGGSILKLRIGGVVQMLPHWRRYLLEHLHTSALAYVFPHPDAKVNHSLFRLSRKKHHYPLLCRQIDCRENPEEVDPVLSVDKEVDWGLLKTFYLNPEQLLIAVAGGIHAPSLLVLSACIWWSGDPVWATITDPLAGKIILGMALICGPLGLFFFIRHRRILNRIETNYAEEQNLRPRDLWDRIRFAHHRYDLSEENIVYGEGTTFADWASDSKKKLYRKYTEMMENLNERIEAREAANEEFRARGESPPIEELQRLEEMKERYNRYRRTRKNILEQYEKMQDGRVIEALRDAKENEEMPPWLRDFLEENDDS